MSSGTLLLLISRLLSGGVLLLLKSRLLGGALLGGLLGGYGPRVRGVDHHVLHLASMSVLVLRLPACAAPKTGGDEANRDYYHGS